MYTLNISNYHDTFNKCYKKIITINNYPEGPLQKYVSRIANKKLSPFQQNTPCCPHKPCIYVINSISNTYYHNFMTPDEISDLFGFLLCNNYTIYFLAFMFYTNLNSFIKSFLKIMMNYVQEI